MTLRGQWGEDAAARHALSKGARVLARNFHARIGELDLVLWHDGVLVFGEVKARRSASHGGGLLAVTPAKQRRIVRTALLFMVRKGYDPDGTPCRFDVFEVRPGPEVNWIQGAFDTTSS